MYGRQSQLHIDVTIGLTTNLVAIPISTKYIQKIGECVRWAHKKANLFQQKEVQCPKQNYERHSKAVALRAGDIIWSISLPSRDGIKYKIGGKTGNM